MQLSGANLSSSTRKRDFMKRGVTQMLDYLLSLLTASFISWA